MSAVTAYAVVFTDRNEMDTEHSAYLTVDDAAHAGAALARRMWDEYNAADRTGEPFPEVDDDWAVMDVLRTAHPVHLEVEEISIGVDVIYGLQAAVCERCHDEPITDSVSGLGPACIANNDGRVVL